MKIDSVGLTGTFMPLEYNSCVYTPNFNFFNVYYIHNLNLRLGFVSPLCDSSYSVMFSFTSCCVHDLHFGRIVRTSRKHVSFMFWMS